MQTIGERLEEARKRKGISIREAAEATKIRGDYLQKFESNQFDVDLPEIYASGFLRSYAHFLKLPAEKILADYRALGLGEPKPRTPSREIYGRMDISVASAGSSVKDTAPESGPVAEAGGAEAGESRPRKFAKIGTSLPEGTYFDPRLVLRIATIAGVVVLVVLLLWGASSLFRSSGAKPAAAAVQPVPEAKIKLIALDSVRVQVENGDRTVLFQGQMVRGEMREFPPVRINVWATARDAIEFEYKGNRYSTGQTGRDWVGFDPTVIKSSP